MDYRNLLLTQPVPPASQGGRLVCLVQRPGAARQSLAERLQDAGYDVRLHDDLDALQHFLARGGRPVTVVLDVDRQGLDSCQYQSLSGIGVGGDGGIALLILSERDDLSLRLAARANGVGGFLVHPVDPSTVVDRLDEMTAGTAAESTRVLVVDDDPLQLSVVESILRSGGFTVRTLNDPMRLLELDDAFRPDVLVLDVHMPGVSGVDLAAVMTDRALQQGRDLPTLFLSGERDVSLQMQALRAGGDDFLQKPVDAVHLIDAVAARARRSRVNNKLQLRLSRALYALRREHTVLDRHAIVSAADSAGNIIYANDRFCEISGYSRHELLGQNHRIVKSGEHPSSLYDEMWATISKGQVWQGEICNRSKDGRLYWVQSTIVPFVDSNGLPYQYLSIRTDVSRIKRDEKVLRILVDSTAAVTGEAFFQKSVEGLATAMGVRMAFIATRESASSTVCRTLALWDQGGLKENFSYDVRHSPCENVLEKGLTLCATGVAQSYPQDQWLAVEGFDSYVGIPLLAADGSVLGHMGVLHDRALPNTDEIVTYLRVFADRVAAEMSRRRIEETLLAHRERLRRGQLYANIGTWDWNIQTGELVWSEKIPVLFGYPAGDLDTSYENFLQAVHPEDRQAVIDAVNACVERDVPYEIEHRVVWPDGTVRWLLERGAVVRDEGGRPLHMLGVVQDVDDRKRAEQALQAKTELLNETQALAHLGAWSVDLQTGRMVWSEQLYAISGLDASLPPPPFSELRQLFLADGWDRLDAALRRAVEHGIAFELELALRLPDGSEGWAWVRGERIQDVNGRPVELRGMVQDISGRKRAENSLAQSERELLKAQALAQIGSWSADVRSGELNWSEEIYRIFGHEPHSFAPSVKAFQDAVHPDDRALVQASEQRAAQTGLHDVVHRIVRPDGVIRHVHELARAELDAQGNVVRLTGTVQDVTEQVEAEARLRETELRFAFAVEGAGDGIWDWDIATGAMPLSGHYEAMLGYAKGELEPTLAAWVQSVHPDDLERVQRDLTDYLEGRSSVYAPELRLRCKDGLYKWILCRGTVVKADAEGRPLRMIGIHSDISDQKKTQEALIEAREVAERANKAKSEFLSNMSHELRTPMNAILGFGQLLQYDDSLSEENRDNVEEILKAGRHLLGLINEVLDLAKIESGRIDLFLEAVEVRPLAEECLRLLSAEASKRRVTIYNKCPPALCVRADRMRLKQVLVNLFSNALKYNRAGGELRVEVQPMPGGRLRITVDDTGKGIAPERLEELFQPFNRLGSENSGIEGTGIGLTITRRLVEMMGGSVGVHSELGQGTQFWIELSMDSAPLSGLDVPSVATTADTADANATEAGTHEVLYIEDNPANIRLVKQILERIPRVVLYSALTPTLGLELARTRTPALILLDINLPDMDGYQVLRLIRTIPALADVPVVAITANAMPGDVQRGLAAGFADYVVKPLDVVEFTETVARLLQPGDRA